MSYFKYLNSSRLFFIRRSTPLRHVWGAFYGLQGLAVSFDLIIKYILGCVQASHKRKEAPSITSKIYENFPFIIFSEIRNTLFINNSARYYDYLSSLKITKHDNKERTSRLKIICLPIPHTWSQPVSYNRPNIPDEKSEGARVFFPSICRSLVRSICFQ